jgi:hypothetical protein
MRSCIRGVDLSVKGRMRLRREAGSERSEPIVVFFGVRVSIAEPPQYRGWWF